MAETDLETFVAEALGQIVRGVSRAQEAATDEGAAINPSLSDSNREVSAGRTADGRNAYLAAFDVAVTVAGESQTGGGGGLKVFAAELSGQGSRSESTESVSRLSFSVPIAFPTEEKTDQDLKEAQRQKAAKRRARNQNQPPL